MFHSSSLRHEQYLTRSHSSIKKGSLIQNKRSSLESEVSRTDSGYTSSSSTTTASSSPTTISRSSSGDQQEYNTLIQQDVLKKKKKSSSVKKYQPPRQPDLVYSCPRPLAFPFHNDDHFLPIAEADPRDVARLTPNNSYYAKMANTSQRSTSIRTTTTTTSHGSQDHRDDESSYSRRSSLLSTIQRGTVRSIRSLFSQTTSLKGDLHNLQQSKLEIKKGTVQSLRDMFNRRKKESYDSSENTHSQVVQQNAYTTTTTTTITTTNKGQRVGTTIDRLENNVKSVQNNTAVGTAPKRKSSLTSRATKFVTKHNFLLWKSTQKNSQEQSNAVTTKPLPKLPKSTISTTVAVEPSRAPIATVVLPSSAAVVAAPANLRTKIKSKVQKLSERLSDAFHSTQNQPNKTHTTTQSSSSFFSSFIPKRSSRQNGNNLTPGSKKGDHKVMINHLDSNDVDEPTVTNVGKLWKNLKRFVNGKKETSRVGVL
ncbi:MAG: hypothetical protein EXX96DRAFT_591964 [Benjaminiella poitrasii]|nr:MAG: hypothetical protein EXX96DRAFT_591964 [Benjaminiella poitrasii]